MTPAIPHKILFALTGRGRELDPYLQCRVKWNASRSIVSLNTGFRVDASKWDADRQHCTAGSFHGARRTPASTINAEISRYEQAVEDAFDAFAKEGTVPTVEAMRAALRSRLALREGPDPGDVLTAFDRFVVEQGTKNSWSSGTLTKMRVVRRHLERWNKGLSWNDFSEAGLSSYLTYLREKRGHQNATLKKQLGYLRWFLAWAENKGYLSDPAFRSYRPKLKGGPKPVIYLEWDELMRLWEWDATTGRDYLGAVRDIFCFCCFTSLRYSDAVNLRWPDVGPESIRITTVKTADPIEIQLNAWSQEILGRYVDEAYPDERVFPTISNQVMNRYLHELCEICRIDEPTHRTWYKGSERHDEVHPKYELVTTHAGRRTFIVNALAMGISPTVVMQWTGHADYDAMRPYIAVADTTKAQAMALFDEKRRGTTSEL